MKTSLALILLLITSSALAKPAKKKKRVVQPVASISVSKSACTSSESWNFSNSIPPSWQVEFKNFLQGQHTPVRGFSEALAMRSLGWDTESRKFGEYWISRALYSAKLPHIAHQGFLSIASSPPEAGTLGVQAAAFKCLVEIRQNFPTLGPNDAVVRNLQTYRKAAGDSISRLGKDPLASFWDLTTLGIIERVSRGVSPAELDGSIADLEGSPSHQYFARGLQAAAKKDYEGSISSINRFLYAAPRTKLLIPFVDQVRLILARAYYTTGQFKKSQSEYKKIRKSSNELGVSLTELSWAYLRDGKYPEAIGTALNLQMGGLRRTFSPEAPMVMAMGLNEICQYPKAEQAVGLFRQKYRSSYEWLAQWYKSRPVWKDKLYTEAVSYLKDQSDGKNKVRVPDRIAGEWVRTPLFISNQQELNLMIREGQDKARLSRSGSLEQNKIAKKVLKLTKDFIRSYQQERIKLKPGDTKLPDYIFKDMEELREEMKHYQRFRLAAPVWRHILKNYDSNIPPKRPALIKEINDELARNNLKMLRHLNEIADNNYFIEVEVYNGASKDMIWKNSYPDYESVAEKLQDGKQNSQIATTWNWGTFAWNQEEDSEIWEDELGSFKADLFDNCSSKDDYLAIKRQEAVERAKKAREESEKRRESQYANKDQ